MIHRNRGNRRWQDDNKAKRKQNICHFYTDVVVGGKLEWYPDFGRYRKGKIHCSCPYCRSKTNDPYYGKNYSIRDRKTIEDMDAQENEWNGGNKNEVL